MKRKQQGFTLIELMIVVAIIAILAAIAIPLYLNYTAQAEGSEALSLMDGAKTAVTQYYNQNGSWPGSNASAGMAPATSITGKYVATVSVGTPAKPGVIRATFKANGVAKPISSQWVELSPSANGGSVQWKCKVQASTMFKDVPTVCRNQ